MADDPRLNHFLTSASNRHQRPRRAALFMLSAVRKSDAAAGGAAGGGSSGKPAWVPSTQLLPLLFRPHRLAIPRVGPAERGAGGRGGRRRVGSQLDAHQDAPALPPAGALGAFPRPSSVGFHDLISTVRTTLIFSAVMQDAQQRSDHSVRRCGPAAVRHAAVQTALQREIAGASRHLPAIALTAYPMNVVR
jgi:hypothetical protein